MANGLPLGCFMFEGKVSSHYPSRLPELEGALMTEIRVHDRRLKGQPVYYMEELSPTAILAKVEHYQREVRGLVKSLNTRAKVVQSFCSLLELVKNDTQDRLPVDPG